jgi:hypothetical protein
MSPDRTRAQRLESQATETFEQLGASMAHSSQLFSALATGGVAPEAITAELTRHAQEHGPDAYRQLTDSNLRFWARSMLIAAAYSSESLQTMVPPHRRSELGPPPASPYLPARADPSDWAAWYLLYTAWAGQLQVWSARAYELIRGEIAAGTMPTDAVQDSGRAFVAEHWADYLSDLTEIGLDLMSEEIGVADESLRNVAAALSGESPTTELVVDVHGPAGTIARADLAIENNREHPADVSCVVTAVDGIGLAIVPASFHLPPGQTLRTSIRVALPDRPTGGFIPAGTITVSGYDEVALLVRVQAIAESPKRSGLAIRALDPATD